MIIHHFIPSDKITLYLQELPYLKKASNIILTKEEKQQLNSIKNPNRKREYLAVRSLLYNAGLNNQLQYKNRKPILAKSDHNISISHCKTHSVIAISQFPVGVDIEIASERVRKPAKRILSKKEKEISKNEISNLTVFWSCKEAIYKINNDLKNFTSDMMIIEHDKSAKIIKVKCKDRTRICHYKNINDLYITWSTDN